MTDNTHTVEILFTKQQVTLMTKTIEILSSGISATMDILSADEMDSILGGDVDCKKKYIEGNVECHKRYTEVGDNIICKKRYKYTK